MSISRRKALKTLGAVPLAAGFTWTPAEAEQAQQKSATARAGATAAKKPFKPAFFAPHEWATVRLLVDVIIPKDERSGSATDAGVPEFMDFMMIDDPKRQDAMRGGLRWLDTQSVERFGKRFVGVHAGRAHHDAGRDRVAGESVSARQPGCGVLQFVPGSHRQRVLELEDGGGRPPVPRECCESRVERVPAGGPAASGHRGHRIGSGPNMNDQLPTSNSHFQGEAVCQ